VSLRQLSTFTPVKDETETSTEIEGTERPRWSYTPEKMKSPFPFKNRIKDTRIEWECNNSPTRLDKFYVNFLGRGGEQMLSDEIKWLAVTHKSFDQGRRGFNDRLAFLGKWLCSGRLNLCVLTDHREENPEPPNQSGTPQLPSRDKDPIGT
jgi:large subunit ribosomal protein L15